MRTADQRAGAAAVLHDVVDLPRRASAARRQGGRHGAIDDLEVAAAGEHLNFTSAKSGSMPVVSQSMIRPIVPVGAMTQRQAADTKFFRCAEKRPPAAICS